MKACLVNYNFDPVWLKDYPDLEVTMYDRSDDGVERNLQQYGRVFKTKNVGNVDYDKLNFLVGNYENLPEVFLWSKTNIFKYCDKQTLDNALERRVFTPLIRPDHATYSNRLGEVCRYRSGWYEEVNNSWYLGPHPAYGINSFAEWAQMFNLPCPAFLPFAPGGSYLLTRERVHRYGVDLYDKMAATMPYTTLPGEAQLAERSYGLMWK